MVMDARSQGWFLSANLIMPGGASVATLLPLPKNQRMLAVGFGGLAHQISEKSENLREILLRNVAEFERGTVTDP